ncbi:hypothetical protein BX666DRAFT_19735 [Dichotomocladium elegans]|nr:hypothetical protein BX666DRAFT_19735 [Dichotomocladium elegans]
MRSRRAYIITGIKDVDNYRCKHACCKPKVVVLGEQAQGVVTGRTQPKKTSKSGVEDTAIPHKNNNNKNVGLLDSLPSPAKENLFVQNDEEDCLKLAAGTETQWPEKCTGDMVAATDGSCLQYATVKKRGMRDDACDRLWDDVGNFAFHVFNTARCVDPIEDSDIPLMPVSNASPRHNTARDKAENDVSSMTDSPSNKFSLSQWLERYTTITKADP